MIPWPPWRDTATPELAAIRAQLNRIETLQERIMTDQTTETAAAAQIETDVTAINAGVQAVQAEIARLQQQNPAIDWTAVNQAVTDLGTATQGVTAAGTITPPPPPAPSVSN